MTGNLLLTGGRIKTMDPANPMAEAVAIINGVVVAVGSTAEVRAAAAAGSLVIDLHGERPRRD